MKTCLEFEHSYIKVTFKIISHNHSVLIGLRKINLLFENVPVLSFFILHAFNCSVLSCKMQQVESQLSMSRRDI